MSNPTDNQTTDHDDAWLKLHIVDGYTAAEAIEMVERMTGTKQTTAMSVPAMPLFLHSAAYARAMAEYPDGIALVAGALVRFVELHPMPVADECCHCRGVGGNPHRGFHMSNPTDNQTTEPTAEMIEAGVRVAWVRAYQHEFEGYKLEHVEVMRGLVRELWIAMESAR